MTEVIFSFDTEDYTNPAADESILRLAETLRAENIRASFNIVAALAEALVARGRSDILDALKFHEINYHSYRHSWHPVPVEYSDTSDWDGPYQRLVTEEGPGITLVKRVFQREQLFVAVPPGNCVTAQALYAYPRMGLPLCVSSFPLRGTPGQTIYYCGSLYIENNAFWDSLLLREGLAGLLAKMDEWRTWERLVICMHPNITYYKTFWDGENLNGANQVAWGQWRLAERRPPEVIEQFYADFTEAVRALKRDPHFTFSTFENILTTIPARQPISRQNLASLLDAVRQRFFFCGGPGASYSLADIFGACVHFLNGSPQDYVPRIIAGPASEPAGVSETLQISAADLRSAASHFTDTPSIPHQIDVGGHAIGPRDFIEASRQILNGQPWAEITPRSQAPETNGFYHLDDARLAGTWLYSPDLKDEWVSKRLKWQAWTIHL